MISLKANSKLFSLLPKIKKDKMDGLAVLIAAENVLIKDITKKGELIIEDLEILPGITEMSLLKESLEEL